MSGEIWHPIEGYEELYEVSNLGNVKSLSRVRRVGMPGGAHTIQTKEKLLKPSILPSGYKKVGLHGDEGQKFFYIHRLVCSAFHGSPLDGQEVCHWDGDRGNNRAQNLRWGTCAENAEDRKRHGTIQLGEENPTAKLTEERVREIRRLYRPRRVTLEMLSKRFGVSESTISAIIRRKRWKHI